MTTTTATATAASPQSPAPQPLPPTPRDFNILHMSHVLHLSTRTIADKHHISQTRVRQIVHRVCLWLAANLPAKTEADQQAEARLAQHLAADQLQHQLEQLRIHFDATGDPKYLRHQTRVIAALARLGIIPGSIDSLAADLAEGPLTNDQPTPATDTNRLTAAPMLRPIPDDSLPTENCPLKTENSSSPSLGACSPSTTNPDKSTTNSEYGPAATASPTDLSDDDSLEPDDDPHGLKYFEQRLLTLLDFTSADDHDRRQSLEKTLARVRRQRACLELQLSPDQPGIVSASSSGADIPPVPIDALNVDLTASVPTRHSEQTPALLAD